MNFLNFLISLQIIFFLALPIASSSQPNKSQSTHAPKPIINQIASLPVGHFGFNSIVYASNNKILFQSNKILWVYDGLNWESYTFPEKPTYTYSANEKLYVSHSGAIESFTLPSDGQIEKNLVLNTNDIESIGRISSLHCYEGDKIYFTSGKNLWCYSDSLAIVDTSNHWVRLLSSTNELFYIKDNLELYAIPKSDGASSLPSQTNKQAFHHPIRIVSINEAQYIISESYPWVEPLSKGDVKIIEELNTHIGSHRTQIKSVRTYKGNIYLLTSSNLLVVWDSQRAIAHSIDLNSHPSMDNVIDFFPFSAKSILVLTHTELYSITPTWYAGIYADQSSTIGKPIAVEEYNGYMYYGTSEGVFAAKYNEDVSALDFVKVESIAGQLTDMHSSTMGCFVATTSGVYKLSNLFAKRIITSAFLNTYKVAFVEHNQGVGIAAANDTIIFSQRIAPGPMDPTLIKFPSNAQSIIHLTAYRNSLIAQTETGSWHTYKLNDEDLKWQGIDEQIGEYGQILFTATQQSKPFIWERGSLYAFNLEKNKRGEILISDSTNSLLPLIETDTSLTLLSTITPFSEISTIWHHQTEGDHFSNYKSIPVATYPTTERIKRATLLTDGTLLVVSNTGLHYFVPTKAKLTLPTVSISKATLFGSEGVFNIRPGYFPSTTSLKPTHQSPQLRNLRVTFGTNISGSWETASTNMQFSSFLSNFDREWTPWTSSNIREVNRLLPGDYTLRVKVRNYWGLESEEATISFTIKPYFYEMPIFVIAFILLGGLALYAFYKWRRYLYAKDRYKLEILINNRTEELVKEKEKTDNLLARVLPKETASELKEKGRVNTQRYQVVTVLFCDIEGFTRITDETNPEALIDQLDKFFLHFDSVVEKYRIEKIKTIGDAYMCAGGIPKKNRTNPVEVVLAALEMLQHMKDIMYKSPSEHRIWEIRIGIDTGPVIAGVVGRNKLSYDIWGSTVNTASRMESSGKAGQINISGNTFMLVSDYFDCTYRGKMPVKNKGDIKMYFVKGIKPKLSVDMKGIVPNKDFLTLLQLIRLGDLEDFILGKLEKGLPKNLYYHNLKHTVDVYTQVELIGRSEDVTNEELLLLRTAALLHDAGHLIDYDTHEEMAVKLAHEILPEYYYSEEQIEIISNLIMSTKLPPNPKNLLEEIMCDADLDYLGRTDFIPVSNMLYRELHEHGKIGTLREWNELQIKFIAKHSYFTKTARKLRNVNKKSQLDKLKKWMEEN